ncbi:MAG: tryptophan--tRNA ligase [Burkholderiaceae bacterium]|nr:tryptophan--tRNA ligase [Burkholderiaceae bacterium]
MFADRVLSGMRPTGAMHLGHYHGVLKNWARLQEEHPCLFFVADWHALTTHYEETQRISADGVDMVIDWLASGVDPNKATIFIQSRVPQHAELFLLLAMATPLGWLERVPTYKDQQQKLSDRDLSTYGFLGYPLMQAADILVYRSTLVPVGEDQVPHIEMTREIARRFNHVFGAEPDFEAKAKAAARKLGGDAKRFEELRTQYQQEGNTEALMRARSIVNAAAQLGVEDRERLFGYSEGAHRVILPEPAALLTKVSRMPGLDGQRMAKSYKNTIALREEPESVTKKIRTMPTDPARVRRTDPGEPERCPVWPLHQVYSDEPTQQWVQTGCHTAGIGCLECKQPVIDAIVRELAPMRERVQRFLDQPALVQDIVADGCDKARAMAEETMHEVRAAMGLVPAR